MLYFTKEDSLLEEAPNKNLILKFDVEGISRSNTYAASQFESLAPTPRRQSTDSSASLNYHPASGHCLTHNQETGSKPSSRVPKEELIQSPCCLNPHVLSKYARTNISYSFIC